MRWLVLLSLCLAKIGAAASRPEPKEWTVLLWLAGDETTIDAPSFQVLKKIESIRNLRQDGNVRIVALHDAAGDDSQNEMRKSYANRFLMEYKPEGVSVSPIPEDVITEQMHAYIRDPNFKFQYKEIDSGNVVTLKDFVRWAVWSYPAKHYALILAGHSWGQAGLMQDFFVDGKNLEEAGKSTLMKNYEVRRAFEELFRELGDKIPNHRWDLLFIDGCVYGQLDIAMEFLGLTDYLAASTLETPDNSMPYDEFMSSFVDTVEQGANSREAVEDGWLKPMVNAYVKSHSRGGSLVDTEKEIDTVELFALRMDKLLPVIDAFKNWIGKIPLSLKEDWSQGKLPNIERLADSDSNADLFELSKSLASEGSKNLQNLLGVKDEDPTLTKTHLDFPKNSVGAWVHLQADEKVPDPMQAECLITRNFAVLNPDAESVPTFVNQKANENPIHIVCNDLAENAEKKKDKQSKNDGYIEKIYDFTLSWPGKIPAFFSESNGERTVSLWIPRPKDTDAVALNFHFAATEKIAIDYLSGSPKRFIKNPAGHQDLVVDSKKESFKGYVINDEFAPDSLYVAEGHSAASYYKRGLGIFLGHAIDIADNQYQGGRLPIERVESTPYAMTLEEYFGTLSKEGKLEEVTVKDDDFYRLGRIDSTGWPEFLFYERRLGESLPLMASHNRRFLGKGHQRKHR